MRLLLDTHAFLWFILDDPKLSRVAIQHIVDPDAAVLVSPASYWEIAIKISLGATCRARGRQATSSRYESAFAVFCP